MVDFNNENTVTVAPEKLIQLLFLEDREQAKASFERYRMASIKQHDTELAKDNVWVNLNTLWDQISPLAVQHVPPKDVERIQDVLETSESDIEDLKEVYRLLNNFFYTLGLTKIDTKKSYVGMSFEEANKEDGL